MKIRINWRLYYVKCSLSPPRSSLTLDDIVEELNKIKNEIQATRKQNMAIYNELAKHHVVLNNSINNIVSQHIGHYLIQTAGFQTSEFIIKNMPKVKTFEGGGAGEILKYSVENSKNDGLFLEFGVFQGNTINIISSMKPNQIVYGFDSFEGLSENWRTGFDKGSFNLNGIIPKVNPNVELIKGWFDDSLPKFLQTHKAPCSFIHIDCDLYSSTKTVLSLLKNQIVSGTILLFDEYFNYPSWQENEHKAFMEFVQYNDIEFEYIAYSMHEQVAVKIK